MGSSSASVVGGAGGVGQAPPETPVAKLKENTAFVDIDEFLQMLSENGNLNDELREWQLQVVEGYIEHQVNKDV